MVGIVDTCGRSQAAISRSREAGKAACAFGLRTPTPHTTSTGLTSGLRGKESTERSERLRLEQPRKSAPRDGEVTDRELGAWPIAAPPPG